ncbi:MAG: histidine kinase, partial [Okeania sp. SIO2C9]|nr:histidine kinase [Okeania sp. SIO2C9]
MIEIVLDPIFQAAANGIALAIGRTAAENGINLLGDARGALLDRAGNLTQLGKNLLFPISNKYIHNYTQRHGIFKVLGMSEPASLDDVYTRQFFNPETRPSFESIEALEDTVRKRQRRNFNSSDNAKRSGIDVANNKQYLLVLGGPGMGKTTFLRKIGLEALQRKKTGYQHKKIPVLIELKRLESTEIDLEGAIVQEFNNCSLPKYQELTSKFLEE